MIRYFILFLLLSQSSFAQVIIEGKLTDKSGSPVGGATITILLSNTKKIVAYDISDDDGNYSITFNPPDKIIDLSIRSMGYSKISRSISNKSQVLNFELTEEQVELKEIVLKSTKIQKKGDTLNYSVKSFKKDQDRTIADVLKRMPGIEVLSDGKISYLGKPINKFYIEGLDLLGGKYNLASQNLPHADVSKIQILENHQPIKILDSLVFSDKAALNIKLKNKNVYTGQLELGSGISPILWQANLTPMIFTKKQQLLASYQSNNLGENVAGQLKTLTIEDLYDRSESNSEKKDWLSVQELAVPSFPEKRWLDNNTHVATANYLRKLKSDYEIRLNVSYLNDYIQQQGSTNTLFFTQSDTITLLEQKNNQLYNNSVEANLTLDKNSDKNHFKNSLKYKGFWDGQRGSITLNNSPLVQNLDNNYFSLSNKLKAIFPIGKQLITLNSFITVNQTPQTLNVSPGQFIDLLNDGNAYDEVLQQVDLNSFYMNNSVGFIKSYKRFSFLMNSGFKFEKQNLRSDIFTSDRGLLGQEFSNDLDWNRFNLYFQFQTQYKDDDWRVQLVTPLTLHSYEVEDSSIQEGQALDRITFEPKLLINYELSSYWRVSTSANFSNQFGTIDQLFYGYILQNYRNIQRIETELPQTLSRTLSGGLSYRNHLKSIFWSISYYNSLRTNNLLYTNQILDNGAITLQAVEQDNDRLSDNLSTRLSKYFNKIYTNFTLNGSYGNQDFQQLLNNELTNIRNVNWTFGGKVDTDFSDKLALEYEANWVVSRNELQSEANQSITQQTHKLNLNIYPKSNQYLGIKNDYVRNNIFSENISFLFTDIVYRYTWEKQKIDFELQWNNIFNNTNYRTITISEFSYVETNFRLRPSQIFFKIRFSL
jgi:hypothetical protein